jgi:predicted transcriptional regulator
MKGVDTIARVRREFFVRGRTIKEICRELHVSRNTVRKIIRSDETAFEYERSVQPQPKIGRGGRSSIGSSPGTQAGRGGSG